MSSRLHKIRRFLALESPRKARFVKALGAIIWVAALLRIRGYRGCREALERRLGHPVVADAAADKVKLDAWAVQAAADQFRFASCLPRSLTLWWLLARQGIESEIHFGVRRDDDDLAAHAWVVWNDQALTDPVDPRAHYTHLGSA